MNASACGTRTAGSCWTNAAKARRLPLHRLTQQFIREGFAPETQRDCCARRGQETRGQADVGIPTDVRGSNFPLTDTAPNLCWPNS